MIYQSDNGRTDNESQPPTDKEPPTFYARTRTRELMGQLMARNLPLGKNCRKVKSLYTLTVATVDGKQKATTISDDCCDCCKYVGIILAF